MKKKFSTIHLVLILIFILLSLIAYSFFNFNKLKSNVELFDNLNLSDNMEFIGLIDDKYYTYENGQLKAFDKNEEIFNLYNSSIKKILLDKVVYLFEKNGRVKIIDRNTGEEKKNINISKNIEFAKFYQDRIIVYSKDSISIFDKKLKLIKEIKNLKNPVDFAMNGENYSIIEVNLENSRLISDYKIFKNDKLEFSLSSDEELFVKSSFIGEKSILFTDSYLYKIENKAIKDKKILGKLTAIDIKKDRIAYVDNKQINIMDNNLDIIDSKNIDEDIKNIYIRNGSIVIIGEKNLMVYQNSNIIKTPINNSIGSYANNQAVYILFNNRIEKINAY